MTRGRRQQSLEQGNAFAMDLHVIGIIVKVSMMHTNTTLHPSALQKLQKIPVVRDTDSQRQPNVIGQTMDGETTTCYCSPRCTANC